MNEPGDRGKFDSVSIVSCSTQMTDTTQDRESSNLYSSQIIESLEKTYRSFDGKKFAKVLNTEGSDMSPIIPLQSVTFTKNSSNEEDTASEMSEVLIPVISNQSLISANKSMFEIQSSQQVDASQSLLAQEPDRSNNLNIIEESSSRNKENRRENDGWVTKNVDNKKDTVCKINDTRDEASLDLSSAINNDISSSQTAVLSSQNDGNAFSQKIDSTFMNEGFTFSQPVAFAGDDNDLTFSQVDNALKNDVEISSSFQKAVHLAEEKVKDPADRIISRLDRLVTSIDKVSSRQKKVIEATILHCITSLQDSLNSKLKKQQSAKDNAGLFKRLLQTTQTGLLKLSEQQRLEKLQLSQAESQSLQPNSRKHNQSALSDFGKRQERVFSLLKRQRHLVDLFKARNRPEVADHSGRFETGKEVSKKSKVKRVSKSEITPPYNTNQERRNRIENERRASLQEKSEAKKKNDHNAASNREGERARSVKCTIEDLSGQVSFMRSDCKDAKLTKRNNGAQFQQKNFESKDGLEMDNGYSEQTEKMSSHVTDITNDNNCEGLENAEDFSCTLDVTAVPETQEIVTLDSEAGNNTDSEALSSITAAISDKVISEGFHGNNRKQMRIGTDSKVNDTSRSVEVNIPLTTDTDILKDKLPFKRDNVSVINEYENAKRSKVNEDEGIKVHDNVIVKQSGLKTSEMLRLNMVREDINKNADNMKISKEKTFERQDEVLPKTQKQKVDSFKEKSKFQFVKPIDVKKPDPREPEDKLSLSNKQNKTIDIPVEKSNKKKEQTNELTKEELKSSVKNTEAIEGLSSPPYITLPGETWHNISPTATSMSSDVFMVKMKDIQKRMKARVDLSQNTKFNEPTVVKQIERQAFDTNELNDKKSADSFINLTRNRMQEKDTVSEAIDAVIQQARDISKENKDFKQRNGSSTNISEKNTLDNEVPTGIERNVLKAEANKKQTMGGLPTLKELVHSGHLTPGKLVLSCFAKGRTHRASLTLLGKIRTVEGLVFVTASQWVSSLTESVSVKKRRAYEMVFYKGKSLLSICMNSCHTFKFLPHKQVASTALTSFITADTRKSFTEQGTQIEDTEFLPQRTDCEKRLNLLLSHSVVRLLTEQDFVTCDDLPDNFWTEDFSKVRLPKDIWDTVDSW